MDLCFLSYCLFRKNTINQIHKTQNKGESSLPGPRRRGSRAGAAARTQPKPNRTESPRGVVGEGPSNGAGGVQRGGTLVGEAAVV